jgi:hypothetical protein
MLQLLFLLVARPADYFLLFARIWAEQLPSPRPSEMPNFIDFIETVELQSHTSCFSVPFLGRGLVKALSTMVLICWLVGLMFVLSEHVAKRSLSQIKREQK